MTPIKPGRRWTIRFAVVCGTAALGCGCAPQATLRVSPEAYCPGTPIHVEWVGTGDTSLKISPVDRDFMPAANSGIRDLPPSAQSIELQTLWHDRRDARHVDVAPVASRPFVGDSLECDAEHKKTKPIEILAGTYDRRTLLESILSSCHSDDPTDPCPEITICHGTSPTDPCAGSGSRSWQVAPGHAADVSQEAVDMAGYWVFARKLLPGESCGPPAGTRPAAAPATPPPSMKMTHLRVQLKLSCAPQGAKS
jgi:hypothetical protein